MNAANLRLLADTIENDTLPNVTFNLDYWCTPVDANGAIAYISHEPACGTIACIAGYAHILSGGTAKNYENSYRAREWLEVDDIEAMHLFTPFNLSKNFRLVQPEEAARVVRHFAETGEIDWSGV